MAKRVSFSEDFSSEDESEYSSDEYDEFNDSEEDEMEGGAYQLASDYDIEYDDEEEDDEGGSLYGGAKRRKKKRSKKKKRRTAYNIFVAKYRSKKKPGTNRYYTIREIARAWRKTHPKKSGSKKSRGGALSAKSPRKKTSSAKSPRKKTTSAKSPNKIMASRLGAPASLSSLLKVPNYVRYVDADNFCEKQGQSYCPSSQTCMEPPEVASCWSKAGISFVSQTQKVEATNGETFTRRLMIPIINITTGDYASPAAAWKWWQKQPPEEKKKYNGPPVTSMAGKSVPSYKPYLGNVALGPIHRDGTGSSGIQKLLGLSNAQVQGLSALGVNVGEAGIDPLVSSMFLEQSESGPAYSAGQPKN